VATTRKPFDFEKSLAELEALVARMEDGKASLEESLRDFELGVKLTQQCQQALNEAQQRVQVLMQQDGEPRTVPFAAPDNGDTP
jgi:exodeoxyribonuclease VII small subunit